MSLGTDLHLIRYSLNCDSTLIVGIVNARLDRVGCVEVGRAGALLDRSDGED